MCPPGVRDDCGIEYGFGFPVMFDDRFEKGILSGALEDRAFGFGGCEFLQEFREAGGGDAGSRIGGTIVEHECITIDGCTGWENDIGYFSVEFVFFFGNEERGSGSSDDAGRISEIKECCLDGEERGAAPVIADIGIQDKPALLGLKRWCTELDLVVIVPGEFECVFFKRIMPAFPTGRIPHVFDFRKGSQGDLGRGHISVGRKECIVFSIDFLRKKGHSFGIEGRDRMPLIDVLEILGQSDSDADSIGREREY